MAAGLTALVSLPAWLVGSTLMDQQTLKTAWTIAGPACPPPAPPPLMPVRSRGVQAFEYKEIRFERQSGAVNCAALPEGSLWSPRAYPVCQFTGPGKLVVDLPTGEAAFEPGTQRATVTVRHGAATCVLGGWFRP